MAGTGSDLGNDMNASGGQGKPGRSRSPPEGSAEAKRSKDQAAVLAAEEKTKSDAFDKTFETKWAMIEPAITDQIGGLCKGVVVESLQEVNAKIDEQAKLLDAMALKVTDNQKSLAELQAGMKKLLDREGTAPSMSHSLSAPALATGAPAPIPIPPNSQANNNPFFREINPRVLFLNTHGNEDVTIEEVIKALTPLMLEANIPETGFTVGGDALDHNFEICLPGDFNTGRARASQFKLSLRFAKGKWKTQEVISPPKTAIKFYINPDKNGTNIRTEVLTKGITDALNHDNPPKTFMCSRSAGLVYCDRRALARIIVTGEEAARLSWNLGTRVNLASIRRIRMPPLHP